MNFSWGLWTHKTHCHLIFCALWTPLWDKNIPDEVCTSPRGVNIIDTLSYMQKKKKNSIPQDSVQVHSMTILVPILEWLYSAGINGPWNGNFGRALCQK